MEPAKRMMVNTIAQYVKAMVNIVLSLYSTRLVLDALAVADYGLYSVVGGIVAMLGFVTNALVITTQRYISYYCGKENKGYVRKIFVNSLFLHIIIGIVLAALLLLLQNWLINSVLNIYPERLDVATNVYEITVAMLFLTIVTAPFKALFIAREDIVYISIVEVFDGVLKLLLAIFLSSVAADKLLVYAGMMGLILLVNLLAFMIYAKLRFEECVIFPKFRDIEKSALLGLMGFAGWTTYGMGAVAARNQGTAVVLNHFFGTAINAAYGIAFQVQSAVSFVSTSILNAMNPQIMKAEGTGNRARSVLLAERESKYSTVLMSIVIIPLVVEMPSVLNFWLKEVPESTVLFCRYVLAAFLFDQMTYGLHSLNQALGNIRFYTLLIYTPKLLTLPIVWLLLSHGCDVNVVMCFYVIVELLVALVRLPYLKATAGLNLFHFLRKVIFPLFFLWAVLLVIGWLCRLWLVASSFFANVGVMLLVGAGTVWFLILDKDERSSFKLFFSVKGRRK